MWSFFGEPFLSWINVLFILGNWSWNLFKLIVNWTPAPPRLRELRSKLSMPNLPKEVVENLLIEYADVAPGQTQETVRAAIKDFQEQEDYEKEKAALEALNAE